jgi:gas vesicle protein
MSKKGNTAGILAGLLAGAAAGVVLGMLYAPEEGKETRKKIKTKASDLKDQAKNKYGRIPTIQFSTFCSSSCS